MKIRLLTVGKIENKHMLALAEMYRQRIDHYAAFEWEIVKPEKIKTLSAAEIASREAKRLEQKFDAKETTILMDVHGRQHSSYELAAFLEGVTQSGKRITFVIGGPLGVAESVKKRTQAAMSLSRMTFPHELAAVMLLEQLYRALTIRQGEKYHK